MTFNYSKQCIDYGPVGLRACLGYSNPQVMTASMSWGCKIFDPPGRWTDENPMQVAIQYFGTFIETMKREWFGIDRLRLDKFMLLVRKFIRQMLVSLIDAEWWVSAVLHVFMVLLIEKETAKLTAYSLTISKIKKLEKMWEVDVLHINDMNDDHSTLSSGRLILAWILLRHYQSTRWKKYIITVNLCCGTTSEIDSVISNSQPRHHPLYCCRDRYHSKITMQKLQTWCTVKGQLGKRHAANNFHFHGTRTTILHMQAK